jgi:hypothetical protein
MMRWYLMVWKSEFVTQQPHFCMNSTCWTHKAIVLSSIIVIIIDIHHHHHQHLHQTASTP